MKMLTRLALAALTCAATLGAHASTAEDTLLAALKRTYPGTAFDMVTATPIPHVFEVWMGDNVGFVADTRPDYMIFGRLVDLRAMRDLTAPKLQQRSNAASPAAPTAAAIDVRQLPLTDAIVSTQGKGERVLYLFTDPHCPYCRQLEPELAKIPNLRIYNFMVPFQDQVLPLRIWCAADRIAAWRSAVSGTLDGEGAPAQCAHPLDRNLALASKLTIQGTPTFFFADGARETGFISASEIEVHLAQAASSRQATKNPKE
ncbi:DsbC family protein [Janthinobacterium sp. NKUCC08_JDC]|uniref:DsbC family protein n=1 Tax=Janthinobacterium sp. NKUCC08_JDC TaxID=2842122 RepID=UPI001C5B47CF|nr:DsbC family protein [Janthinobacterium sp. NKUCC08_JDC]MBW3499957.1 DsbC family protein [Janthinobacterium sp. NKUCC08_JDC]